MKCSNNLNVANNCNNSEDATVQISRVAYNLTAFEKAFDVIQPEHNSFCEKFVKRVKPSCDVQHWKRRICTILPIVDWLPKYNVKENLLSDIITGITVAVFQVPQKSSEKEIFSFTSYVGACAILSGVMTGNLVTQVMQENGVSLHQLEAMNTNTQSAHSTITSATDFTNSENNLPNIQSFEIASAAAFWIGIYMLLFGVLRLGFISIYLSEQLISGFATAASLYVFTSQLRYLFGVHLPYNSGMIAIIRSYVDLAREYRSINPVTTLISVICCSILLFFKVYVNEQLRKRGFKIPFPVELLVVISGTIVSNLLDLNGNYNVQIVGEIKRGLPLPEIPRLEILQQTWLRSISLATVGYTLNLTVGKLYGSKHGYECVLASVIAVALKNLLSNAKEFKRYWKISKPDGAIWMVSFAGVVILDIDFGLYFAVAFSLLVLIFKSSRPKSYILGAANNSDVYVPLRKYVFASEIPGIKIYQFCGPLHFANKDFFKNDILKKTQLKER
ncbi:solute carrier family 26 member 6-like isoform X2 [Leptotrombidium deliense]|uniref:Solute carrier family 26 member 6-like isoform X2 n=1 Tax=Leptotrombidium deliense TaxID=299467 RepID=A0A443SK66_9ACAR|nr:solute carrier family 26 member 6-like isoform X2 [Leptotrombidium deliense]